MTRLTAELLAEATGCTAERAAVLAPHLDEACAYYGISATVERLAMALAQWGHESQGFAAGVESLNYSVDGLLRTFSRERISEAEARAFGRDGTRPADQQAIANTVYGGSWGLRNLGNTQHGDGWHYRGRGPVQLTGRANYARLRDRLRSRLARAVPDFEADPDALLKPEWGAWAAADFWDMRGLNALADAGHFALVTRRINGGTNGMEDRERRWELARRVLAEHRDAPAPIEDRSTSAAAPVAPRVPLQARTQDPAPPATPAEEKPMVAPLLLKGLASTVISLFTPLAAEKLRKEIGRHTDDSAVADQLTHGVIEATKAATGLTDPIQAVAAVQSDPQALQVAERNALVELERLSPLIQQLDALEAAHAQRVEASRDAAEARARGALKDQDDYLTRSIVRMMVGVLVGLGVLAAVLSKFGVDVQSIIGTILTLVGVVAMSFRTRIEHRYGSSQGSAAKDAVIAAMGDRAPPAR